MKFEKIHLFLILLLSLIFAGFLGEFVREGMSSNKDVVIAETNTNASSALPKGIYSYEIPPGQEDMYILKSEVVPPVCPVCPQAAVCPKQEKCQPCPPCARCPEPAFECKKVPNYSSSNDNYLPRPVLADFSQFGM
jgi:hypothetical protein